MTSGLLIVALNKATANQFLELFSERKIDKYYLAVSNSKPKKKQGWIKGDMLATRNGSWKLAKTMIKPAITRFISVSIQSGERLYLLKPETGKTHQLRVALKSISAPICGDQRYANRVEAIEEDRGYLHAYALKFNLAGHLFEFVRAPENGSRFLTKACRGKIEEWTKPWSLFK
jgi:tRNA pseudouridine32 synthase/23S rRNA pseudouridine746 synthase